MAEYARTRGDARAEVARLVSLPATLARPAGWVGDADGTWLGAARARLEKLLADLLDMHAADDASSCLKGQKVQLTIYAGTR